MPEKIDFADFCIRGIKSDSDIQDGHLISANAYNPNFCPENPRDDGFYETSINWKDDDSVLQFSLFLKKDDRFAYKCGVVELPREALDRAKRFAFAENNFDYERQPKPDINNEFHGNILFHKNLNIKFISNIAISLANESSHVFTRELFKSIPNKSNA